MFGVCVGGGNTAVAAFFVADDDPIGEWVKGILLAEHSEKLDSGLIGAPCHGPSGREIGADERGSVSIANAGRLTHLHPDVGVIRRPSSVPTSPLPGKGLIDIAGVAVNESMDTGAVVGWAVPVFDEHLSGGLGAPHRVEH